MNQNQIENKNSKLIKMDENMFKKQKKTLAQKQFYQWIEITRNKKSKPNG